MAKEGFVSCGFSTYFVGSSARQGRPPRADAALSRLRRSSWVLRCVQNRKISSTERREKPQKASRPGLVGCYTLSVRTVACLLRPFNHSPPSLFPCCLKKPFALFALLNILCRRRRRNEDEERGGRRGREEGIRRVDKKEFGCIQPLTQLTLCGAWRW